MRNSWRYAYVMKTHIRIHPPTADVSVIPPGTVRYVATIEVLDSESDSWGRAEEEAVTAIEAVFASAIQ
jgi:hypothetical protein